MIEYVTHDEMIRVINALFPIFFFMFVVCFLVFIHMVRVFIDNVSYFVGVLRSKKQ